MAISVWCARSIVISSMEWQTGKAEEIVLRGIRFKPQPGHPSLKACSRKRANNIFHA